MNSSRVVRFLFGMIVVAWLSVPSQGAIISVSYEIDLDKGFYRNTNYNSEEDTSQSFSLMDGDALVVDVSFANGKSLLLRNNISMVSTGLEIIGLELPLMGLPLNRGDTVVDITGFSGDLNSTRFTSTDANAIGLLSPRVATNITDTEFVLTSLMFTYTVVGGLPTPTVFDTVNLQIFFGSPIEMVPEPTAMTLWFLSGAALLARRQYNAC